MRTLSKIKELIYNMTIAMVIVGTKSNRRE